MHSDLRPILKPLCDNRQLDDPVFDMPPRTDVAKLVRADCKTAGVDPTHVDFHALRHTMITRLAEKNVHPKIVQILAGHADISTTLNYYTHFKTTDETAAINLL
jgi:integrase